MSGDAVGGFKHSPLVNGNINHHTARLHRLYHLFCDQLWRRCTRNQNRTNHQITVFNAFGNVQFGRHERLYPTTKHLRQLFETGWV